MRYSIWALFLTLLCHFLAALNLKGSSSGSAPISLIPAWQRPLPLPYHSGFRQEHR